MFPFRVSLKKQQKNIKASNFSARYSANYTATKNGSVSFELNADDGYRFLVNGKEVLNAWKRNRWGGQIFKLKTKKDSVYNLVVEYWQGEGKANVVLQAGNYEKIDIRIHFNSFKNADAFVFVGGISPQLEEEEMQVNFSGFNGGDRTSILLPKIQTELMKLLKRTGKPVVFVMMTGSAIAIPWEAKNIPAIMIAWYGGQATGTAIADVLFGDYNPAGRLPITFYKSDADLPPFIDYNKDNRTYRYFIGIPRYGFGYGLSYTSFKYDQLKIPSTVIKGEKVSIEVRVTNSGMIDGEEVAQLYVINQDLTIKAPLKGFDRISLKSGESKSITFILSPEDLSYITSEGKYQQYIGKVKIAIGGHQPEEPNKTNSNVITKIITVE